MTVRPDFPRPLSKHQGLHTEDKIEIGVSVLTRDPEAVAKDIERRFLGRAEKRHSALLSRWQKEKHRKRRKEKRIEAFSDATGIEFSENRDSARSQIERNDPLGSPRSTVGNHTSIEVRVNNRGEFEISADYLTYEEAAEIANAIFETVDGDRT